MTTSPQEETFAPARQLYFFDLFANNRPDNYHAEYPLLNNMRQQLRITIRMIGLDANGTVVPLSETDLSTLKIIDYDTSQELPFEQQPVSPWSYGTTTSGYRWDESLFTGLTRLQEEQGELFASSNVTPPLPAELEVDSASAVPSYELSPGLGRFSDAESKVLQASGITAEDYQYREFLVATSATSRRRLAARITLGDVNIRTNYADPDIAPGTGKEGKFNSSLYIVPKVFPNLPDINYGTRQANQPQFLQETFIAQNPTYGTTRTYEAKIGIRLSSQKDIAIDHVAVGRDLGDICVYGHKGASSYAATTHTYIAPVNQTTVHFNIPAYIGVGSSFKNSDEFLKGIFDQVYHTPPRMVTNAPGELIIGHMVTGLGYWFHDLAAPGAVAQIKQSVRFSVFDVYGNVHGLVLELDTGTRFDNLRLSKG